MIVKKLIVFILVFQLLLPGLAFSAASLGPNGPVCDHPGSPKKETYNRLCNNVDDVLCNEIPDSLRRSCDERDHTIIHSGMTAKEVGGFAVQCFKSAIQSIEKFFTEFLPELCTSLWKISKNIYNSATKGGIWDSVKGAYESAKSTASDVYEAVHKNPGLFFSRIWDKIVDGIKPMITNYDCLNPTAKVGKICSLATTLLFPPMKMALLIVKGSKGVKGLSAELIAKMEKNSKQLSRAEFKILFNRYTDLGYSIDDLKLIKANGKLQEIDFDKLKPLSTKEGQAQYLKLTGKNHSNAGSPISLKSSKTPEEYKLQRRLKVERKNAKYKTKIVFTDDQKIVLNTYKERYPKQVAITDDQSSDFIEKMKLDDLNSNAKVVYFDLENSLQKKLNDDVFGEKDIVNSLNNSFFIKFNEEISSNKELSQYIDGKYKDYKSLRLRLKYSSEEERIKIEGMLAETYKKINEEFAQELKDSGINKLIPPDTKGISDTSKWMLAGTGSDAIEANAAARIIRYTNAPSGTLSLYRTHTQALHGKLNGIRALQLNLANKPNLINGGVLDNIEGTITPSKSIINILRKTKRNEYKSDELYIDKIRSSVHKNLGTQLDDETIKQLSDYFEKVDSISPPLFSGKRILANLAEAEHGIVSVDFAGVGVDNIYNQMKKLAQVDLAKSQPEVALKESFQKMKIGVDKVSDEMGSAKNSFSTSVSGIDGSDAKSHLFSGDDGIYMPKGKAWSDEEKIKLVKKLSVTDDPSKYRVTFVSTRSLDGKNIPTEGRSSAVVRAETVEKDLRARITSVKKIPESEAKKIITAIDYTPQDKGGTFNLIVGGKSFTEEEKKLIEKSFASVLSNKKGETVGKIIYSELIP